MKKKLKIIHKDNRGKIIDIFVNKPKDHCTLVTFNRNSIRGNHFHKKSEQFSYILTGKLLMLTAKINKKGKIIGPIKKEIINDNFLVSHKPFYAHAFKALKKSSMLAFVNGKRGGKKYELDTYRLDKKLI
tara:strand:- start:126 stop:515 length:390 start_codon:yes stop_codon:yes gene_type:complete